MTLLLTERDVRSLLTMDLALEAVEESFRELAAGRAVNHPRRRLPLKGGLLHYMASILPAQNVFGMKLYPTGLGPTHFLIPLYNAETGRLLALIEGDWLGRLRTGAASGVATKYMARPESKTLGLIGAGGQARTQLLAVCAARPIETVRVYSRSAEKRAQFAAEMQPQVRAKIAPVDSAQAAVEGADIVTTMTSASAPVLEGAWLAPGAHVNAAGSNHLKRREIDGETVRRAGRIAADSVEQAQMECGDLAQAVAEGIIAWENVIEFADIVGGKAPGRASAEEITLFESQGLSIWDIATAARVFALALERGVGQQIALFE
jgi:ornithine cyclodeaminase/alanine dehydrogenase-like protein (mu-crystallin family)